MNIILKKDRESNFELLRLICIFGIIIMHTNGAYLSSCTGINLIWSEVENGIFQSGVSLFILISGYFGIKTTVKKIVKLEIQILFYSIVCSIISYIFIGESWTDIIKAFIPISTNRYWFLTCYMILMIFAPFINKAIEQMNKVSLQKLLIIMFLVFSLAPTIFYYHVMNDGGKGIANMLFLYMLGYYVQKYGVRYINNKKIPILLITLFTAFFINTAASYFTGGIGAHAPMSRDCSAFIVVQSLMIFLIFKDLKITSPLINKMAKHVVGVYMFEYAVRIILKEVIFDWTIYSSTIYWALVEILVATVVITICILFDTFRMFLFNHMEDYLSEFANRIFDKIIILIKFKIDKNECEVKNI